MTSTAWQSAAFERIIVSWTAMIVEVFGIIVGLIVANAGNVRNILQGFGAHALARRPSREFAKAVMVDFGGKSDARRALPRRGRGSPASRDQSRGCREKAPGARGACGT